MMHLLFEEFEIFFEVFFLLCAENFHVEFTENLFSNLPSQNSKFNITLGVKADLHFNSSGEFTKPGRQRQPERHLKFRKASLVSVRYL